MTDQFYMSYAGSDKLQDYFHLSWFMLTCENTQVKVLHQQLMNGWHKSNITLIWQLFWYMTEQFIHLMLK